MLGVLARLRRGVVALTAAWAVLLAFVYVEGQPFGSGGSAPARLWSPALLFRYEATYLGNVLQVDRIASPMALGCLALVLVTVAAARVLRKRAKPASLAMVGAMLFVVLSGIVTASGRTGYGVEQALSSRYVTGPDMPWSAMLVFWWIDPPAGRLGRPARVAVLMFAAVLLFGACRAHKMGRQSLEDQHALQVRAGEVLRQGRDDPAIPAAGAGDVDRVEWLAPFLKDLGISVFAGHAGAQPGSATQPSH